MIPIKQIITRKGSGFDAKTWRGFLKKGWLFAGRNWHKVALPKHFEKSAVDEYGYQKRTRAHMIRKASKFGHQLPLVFSGRMEREVLRIVDVRETAKMARVVLHGPPHLHAYRKDLNAPDLAKELKTVSKKDADVVGKDLDKSLIEQDKAENKLIDITKGHRR